MVEEITCERCELNNGVLNCSGCRVSGRPAVREALMAIMGASTLYLLISLLTTSIYQIPLIAIPTAITIALSLYTIYALNKGVSKALIAATATAIALGLATTLIIFTIGLRASAAALGSGWVIYGVGAYELLRLSRA
ncbi:hypothetical protein JCM16161A_15880 [Vulcanisaeta sp. JCM 16161]|uniref:hypothetical protein n=1 Tax=Vulcanisaeta sp. JCM 16161 TaxID=1295372 RepID=UPI00406C02A9